MPGLHAKLSPSSAKQWMACTPSIKLEENFPRLADSSFAQEGTLAHDIAEQKLTKWINKKRNKIECEDKEMDDYTDQYRDYVIEVYNTVKKTCKDPQILVEQRLDLAEWTIDGFGTGDCIIIGDDTLHIIDLKYGKGIAVSAHDNPQLMLYALGAVKEFGILYDFTKVDMHIMQPRIDNTSDVIMEVAELIHWGAEKVRPRAELAYDGKGEYVSGDHCKWCRAKATCKARAEHILQLSAYGLMDPDLLSNPEVSEVLGKVDELVQWAKDVKDYALNGMLHGMKFEGYKLVEGRSVRVITDEDGLVNKLTDAGYDKALLYAKKLETLTKLEKLVGKKDFATLAQDFVDKPAGAPTLAPASDKRRDYNSGASDFADELAA